MDGAGKKIVVKRKNCDQIIANEEEEKQ